MENDSSSCDKSSLVDYFGELLGEILLKGFDEDRVAVINGEVDVAKAFSELPFDHLLFTGSIQVGKLVMRDAAAYLTPVTLELGGKSPVIIADDIPLCDIIDRIVFAKSLNGGQTCVAPDEVTFSGENSFSRQISTSFCVILRGLILYHKYHITYADSR